MRPASVRSSPTCKPFLEEADAVMVDGTFWTDDEMIKLGISKKRARDIGHLPQSGPGGMIEVLKPLPASRKILIHINNTNPILNEDSPQHAELERAGIEVAYDGMDIDLVGGDMGAPENMTAKPWSKRRIRAAVAREGQALSHPSSLPDRDEQRQAHQGADSRLGVQPFLLPDRHSRSKMRQSCPTCRIATSAGSGSRASSITTARRATKAASTPG